MFLEFFTLWIKKVNNLRRNDNESANKKSMICLTINEKK